METSSVRRTRIARLALGLVLCAGLASAQYAGFNVGITNDTGKPAYRIQIITENPLASTVFAIPLNSYMVDGNLLQFYGPLPVLNGRKVNITWFTLLALPANIVSYQWMDRAGTTAIGPEVLALRFTTDANGQVSICNPSQTDYISYTSLKMATSGLALLPGVPASGAVPPAQCTAVADIGAATAAKLTFIDQHCGTVYYYRPAPESPAP